MDGLWYRAVVRQSNVDCFTVLFIDYGNEDTLSVSEIKSLKLNN